jgi:hypothetical protein
VFGKLWRRCWFARFACGLVALQLVPHVVADASVAGRVRACALRSPSAAVRVGASGCLNSFVSSLHSSLVLEVEGQEDYSART